ncbi:MAG: acyltransferase, partial [Sporichthyaceae bacterium]|nr:acyltransferase [Sporichthyaceae bacterium]
PFLPGGFVGVDVFFVISGFLITGLLVNELNRTGRISLLQFYARRAKRLLPATAIVLLATAALVVAFVPKVQWKSIGGDIVASAMYVVNWRLADRSVDYLAEDTLASPVQHFWSLAVEEQYYLVWPLLLLLITWWARRHGRSLTSWLWIGLAVIALPSLAWSIAQTAYEPAKAYFITTTRMWELAIGAGVAIGATQLNRMPRALALVLGWGGLLAIAITGLAITVETAWPGYAAALPTLGAAAVIASGVAAGRYGPVVLLGTGLFRWVGALSYSLYLWHWPLVAIATAHWGELSVSAGLAIVTLSFIPAWLTYRLVENPFRYSRAISRSPRLSLSLGANFTLAGVVAGLLVALALPTTSGALAQGRSAPGAAALSQDASGQVSNQGRAIVESVDWVVPDPLLATEDVPEAYADSCQVGIAPSDLIACDYGVADGKTTVALVGDSKALQWLPALQELATSNDWHVVTYTKSGCPLANAMTTLDGTHYESCAAWNAKVLEQLTGPDRPDYVFTSQRRTRALDAAGAETQEAMQAALRSSWSTLTDAGIDVIVLADNPDPHNRVYECVAENMQQLSQCTFSRADGARSSAAPVQAAAAKGMPGVEMIDLVDAICPGDSCPPVIGQVLVYRQGSHLTATYVTSLSGHLRTALDAAGLTIR